MEMALIPVKNVTVVLRDLLWGYHMGASEDFEGNPR